MKSKYRLAQAEVPTELAAELTEWNALGVERRYAGCWVDQLAGDGPLVGEWMLIGIDGKQARLGPTVEEAVAKLQEFNADRRLLPARV